jgi:hypothetical protein
MKNIDTLTEMFSYLSKNFIEILKNNYLWNYCILIVNKTKDYIHIFPAFITSVIFFVSITSFAQNQKVLIFPTDKTVRPLEELPIICKESGMLSVKDSKGRVYIKCQALTVT